MEYGRWTIRGGAVPSPSVNTPIVMYWPDSNGVGSASNLTQKVARDSCASSRRMSAAL